MDFWITFWTALFFLCIAIFAGVTIVVAVGGVGDIRTLFKRIDAQHRSDESQD